MSTTEAGLGAMALVMKQGVLWSNMMTELGFEAEFKTSPLYIDYTSTLRHRQ